MTDWHGYFRRSAGPGWVLVGDAGHFKDFTPAQGIADALRQAQRLAASITGGLDQDGELDARLRRWWQWRDEDAYDMYWLAKDMGVPGVSTPLITSVIREIAGSEAATQQWLRVLNHEIPPSKLFTAGRLVKAAARALRDQPRRIPVTLGEIVHALKDEIYRGAHRYRIGSRFTANPLRRERLGRRCSAMEAATWLPASIEPVGASTSKSRCCSAIGSTSRCRSNRYSVSSSWPSRSVRRRFSE